METVNTMLGMTTKTCRACKAEKASDQFYGRGPASTGGKDYAGSRSGLSSKCRQCIKAKMAEYREKNPAKVRESWRKVTYRKNFGITIEEYDRLYAAQDGMCAICRIHQSGLAQALHVDHDHGNGRVRGLLCAHCNHAIGKFKDSVAILEAAIDYLNRTSPGNGENPQEGR